MLVLKPNKEVFVCTQTTITHISGPFVDWKYVIVRISSQKQTKLSSRRCRIWLSLFQIVPQLSCVFPWASIPSCPNNSALFPISDGVAALTLSLVLCIEDSHQFAIYHFISVTTNHGYTPTTVLVQDLLNKTKRIMLMSVSHMHNLHRRLACKHTQTKWV